MGVGAVPGVHRRDRGAVAERGAFQPHGYFFAGSPFGTPIERQRFFFSSQSFSARLRLAAAAEARASSGFSGGASFGDSSVSVTRSF